MEPLESSSKYAFQAVSSLYALFPTYMPLREWEDNDILMDTII